MSLIAPDDVLGMTAVLLGLAWLGFLVDGSRFGRAVPGVVVILCVGLALSNLGIAPFSSTAGGFVGRHVVAAAIPLLMIKADFRRIFLESGRVMISFAVACVGVISGVVFGYLLFAPWHPGAKVAGFYAGAFIGGTISMVAVGNAVGMTPAEISSATGASMIPSVCGLMALVSLPKIPFVRRWLPDRPAEIATGSDVDLPGVTVVPLKPAHVAGALALAFSITFAARLLGTWITEKTGHDQSQYHILYVTALTVMAANLAPKALSKLKGEFDLGMIAMYLFFAMIGLGTDMTSFLANAISLFFYVLFLLGTAIVITVAVCRWLRVDLAETMTGLGAAIVGPVATVAVVAGRGWHSMVSPAIMTGIFCHIVGNFVGVTVASLLW